MKISKSKRQLAQLLIEAGVKQFPKGSNWAAQDRDTIERDHPICLYANKPHRNKGSGMWNNDVSASCVVDKISFKTIIPNWHQAVLSRDEFDRVVAESAEVEPERSCNEIRWVNGSNIYATPTSHDCMAMLKERGDSLKCDCEECNAFYNRKELSCSINSATAPTLDQLLQDYRNAADFAAAKRAEADEAAKMREERWKAAQARACELGVHISVELVVDAEMREFEPVITDWRDLRVGDVIALTGNSVELEAGEYEVCDTEGVSYHGKYSIRVSAGELGRRWISNDSWRFIRRP